MGTQVQALSNDSAKLHRLLETELEYSAVMSWQRAPALCWQDDARGTSCQDYHRLWQILLLLKVTRSLQTDADFLISTYRKVLREQPQSKILVSGAADYGLLAHLLWAADLEGARPEITVVDRCATSLMLNSWYAKRRGMEIEAVCGDILTYLPQTPFDLICTHSFLGWFSPAEQKRLLRCWRQSLHPTGAVVTSIRLRPGSSPASCRPFEQSEVVKLQERVEMGYRSCPLLHTISLAELLETVERYCVSRTRYSFASAEQIDQLFTEAGLQVTGFRTGSEPGASRPSGPQEGASGRVNLIAVKNNRKGLTGIKERI